MTKKNEKTVWDFLKSPILLTDLMCARQKVNKKIFCVSEIDLLEHENVYLCLLTADEVDINNPIVFGLSEDKQDDNSSAIFASSEESFEYHLFVHSCYGIIPILLDSKKLHLCDLLEKFLQEDLNQKKTCKLPEFIVSYGNIKANDEKNYHGFFITELAFDSKGYFDELREKRLDKHPQLIIANFLDYLCSLQEIATFFDLQIVKDYEEENEQTEELFITPEVIEDAIIKKVRLMKFAELETLIKKSNKKLSDKYKFHGPWDEETMKDFVLRNDLLEIDDDVLKISVSDDLSYNIENGKVFCIKCSFYTSTFFVI